MYLYISMYICIYIFTLAFHHMQSMLVSFQNFPSPILATLLGLKNLFCPIIYPLQRGEQIDSCLSHRTITGSKNTISFSRIQTQVFYPISP